jgi:hypothetical protein
MNVFKRFSILFFSLLILSGSGGWVLTSHFCKSESQCGSETEMSCCCSGEEEVPPTTGDLFLSGTDACCISSSTYFSMPLYRAEVIHDFSNAIFLPAVNTLPYNPLLAVVDIDFPVSYKPPLPESGGVDFLLLTGLFLI